MRSAYNSVEREAKVAGAGASAHESQDRELAIPPNADVGAPSAAVCPRCACVVGAARRAHGDRLPLGSTRSGGHFYRGYAADRLALSVRGDPRERPDTRGPVDDARIRG